MRRLGLVGAGRWGRNIVRTIAESRRAKLVCVASRNPGTADILPRDCRIVDDWYDLISDVDLDGVIVATPPALHPQIVLFALEAGLSVLVEKPLALTVEEAGEIRARAAVSAGLLMVDHTYLFHPAWTELKRRRPQLGPVRAIRSVGGNWGPFRAETTVLWDWGPHDVSMCIDLIEGMPEAVSARRVRTEQTPEGRGELLHLILDFEKTRAEVKIGNIMSTRTRLFEVEFAGATVIIDDTAEHKLRCGGRAIPIADTRPLTAVIDAFIDAIAGESFDNQGLDLAVRVVDTLELCDAALEARPR